MPYHVVLTKPLARGGYAWVWEGTLRRTDVFDPYLPVVTDDGPSQLVAVKLLYDTHPKMSAAEVHKCEDAEVNAYKQLQGARNAAQLVGCGTLNMREYKLTCIVMERYKHSLQTALERSEDFSSEIRQQQLMKGVLNAVQDMHSRGIVHRDIKPGNVLLTADGQPYITDFGFARAFSDVSDADTLLDKVMTSTVGTPLYVSPSMLTGRYGARVDLWGVGVIMVNVLVKGRLHHLFPHGMSGHPAFVQKLASFVNGGDLEGELGDLPSGQDSVRDFVAACCGMGLYTCSCTAEELLHHPWMLKTVPA